MLNENHGSSNNDGPRMIWASLAAKLQRPLGKNMKSPEPLSEGGKEGESQGPTENSGEGQRDQGIIIGIIIQVFSASPLKTP